jgi:hypothetical protein
MATETLLSNAYVAFSTSTGSAVYTERPDLKSLEMPFSRAELANSVMGDSAETFAQGLISLPISLTYRQSYTTAAATAIDKFFYDRLVGGTKFRMKVRAVDAAVSGTNPSYISTPVIVTSYTPISGQHGQLLEQSVTLRLASGATITRSTST